jgi:hypothetical protein
MLWFTHENMKTTKKLVKLVKNDLIFFEIKDGFQRIPIKRSPEQIVVS